MLNKFKNVLYGSSNQNDEESSNNQCRKPTLREQLYREVSGANWNTNGQSGNNNGLVNVYKSKVSNNSSNNNTQEHDKIIPFLPREITRQINPKTKTPKFRYSRPKFLQLKTDDEILVSADHQIRPIILPRDVTKLPWNSGYAECINAGKSARNEDQAVCYQNVMIRKSAYPIDQLTGELNPSVSIIDKLPWVYFGIFDGHAGNAVAVAAANQLHKLISEKLEDIVDILIALKYDFKLSSDDSDSDEYSDCKETKSDAIKDTSVTIKNVSIDEESKNNSESLQIDSPTVKSDDRVLRESAKFGEQQETDLTAGTKTLEVDAPVANLEANLQKSRVNHAQPPVSSSRKQSTMTDLSRNINIALRHRLSVDELIIGTLEAAFCEMDALIARDKQEYDMRGGCTALVSLFILGKLYVCNAGDSRAIVCKDDEVIPMSFDFTPTSERERILRLGQQRPEFLGTDFTHLEFLKRPTRQDLGKQMLYKDAYMTGWSMKTITYDDLKFPLVWGEGKRSRVLATIGVTRGFGDHELRAQYGSVPIKPFLTAEPEVKVLDIENDENLTPKDVLIMGSDGLWDVTTNHEAKSTVLSSSNLFPDSEESRCKYQYMTAAQDLVIQSRGHTTNWNNVWRTNDDRMASLDDISVFVIPLEQYRNDCLEWNRLRSKAVALRKSKSNKTDVPTVEKTQDTNLSTSAAFDDGDKKQSLRTTETS